MSRKKRIKISIILSVNHSIFHLIRCLEALKPQLKKIDEIIVVGNKNIIKPITSSLITKNQPNVTFYVSSEKSRQRNIGLKYIKGNIIVFIDDDCIVISDWLYRVRKLSRISPKNIYQGNIKNILSDNSFINRFFLRIITDEWDKATSKFKKKEKNYINFLHSECFFLPKDTLLELIRFFNKKTDFLDQGILLTTGLQLIGYKIVYDPKLNIQHYKEKITFCVFLRKILSRGYQIAVIERKYAVRSRLVKKLFVKQISHLNDDNKNNIFKLANNFLPEGRLVWLQAVLFLIIKHISYSVGYLIGWYLYRLK
jgi:glycosyltransferase involved in cell wall biosynthesis